MENSNINQNKNEQSSNTFECYICMDKPTHPVATSCGHIFCWKCLLSWAQGKTELVCPICRNGIDLSRVIPLYSNSHSNNSQIDDRPKVERVAPVRQQTSYFGSVMRGFGFYGVNSEEPVSLPSRDEVKVNQMSAMILLIGFTLVIAIIYLN